MSRRMSTDSRMLPSAILHVRQRSPRGRPVTWSWSTSSSRPGAATLPQLGIAHLPSWSVNIESNWLIVIPTTPHDSQRSSLTQSLQWYRFPSIVPIDSWKSAMGRTAGRPTRAHRAHRLFSGVTFVISLIASRWARPAAEWQVRQRFWSPSRALRFFANWALGAWCGSRWYPGQRFRSSTVSEHTGPVVIARAS